MIYFLHKSGYETGQNLYEELTTIDEQEKLSKHSSAYRVGDIKKKWSKRDLIVRWGDSKNPELDSQLDGFGVKFLNKAKAIIRNTNKLKALELFRENGLNVPSIFYSKYDINKFPVLGRDRHHCGGTDIVIINGSNFGKNNHDLIPDKDFYIGVIPSSNEYRFHVFNGVVIRITKKKFRGHDKDGNPVDEKGIIKNDTYGWGHSHVDIEDINYSLLNLAIESVRIIGLEFGAVDMLISADGKPYVLEVNTAPRLNSIGLEIYSKEIMKYYNDVVDKKSFLSKWL